MILLRGLFDESQMGKTSRRLKKTFVMESIKISIITKCFGDFLDSFGTSLWVL